MNMPNIEKMMISISEVKKQLSEVVNKQLTKIIIKNNMPLSAIMPYEEYLSLVNGAEEVQKQLRSVGQEITLPNGVKVMVCVEYNENDLIIKTYKKMKTSGDYSLHYTQSMSHPSYESTLTTDELREYWLGNKKENKDK